MKQRTKGTRRTGRTGARTATAYRRPRVEGWFWIAALLPVGLAAGAVWSLLEGAAPRQVRVEWRRYEETRSGGRIVNLTDAPLRGVVLQVVPFNLPRRRPNVDLVEVGNIPEGQSRPFRVQVGRHHVVRVRVLSRGRELRAAEAELPDRSP